jgi:hypothetical protein
LIRIHEVEGSMPFMYIFLFLFMKFEEYEKNSQPERARDHQRPGLRD